MVSTRSTRPSRGCVWTCRPPSSLAQSYFDTPVVSQDPRSRLGTCLCSDGTRDAVSRAAALPGPFSRDDKNNNRTFCAAARSPLAPPLRACTDHGRRSTGSIPPGGNERPDLHGRGIDTPSPTVHRASRLHRRRRDRSPRRHHRDAPSRRRPGPRGGRAPRGAGARRLLRARDARDERLRRLAIRIPVPREAGRAHRSRQRRRAAASRRREDPRSPQRRPRGARRRRRVLGPSRRARRRDAAHHRRRAAGSARVERRVLPSAVPASSARDARDDAPGAHRRDRGRPPDGARGLARDRRGVDLPRTDSSRLATRVAASPFARSEPPRGMRRGVPRARPTPRRVAHRRTPRRRGVRSPRTRTPSP